MQLQIWKTRKIRGKYIDKTQLGVRDTEKPQLCTYLVRDRILFYEYVSR